VGKGIWDAVEYESRRAARKAAGVGAFAHTDRIRTGAAAKVHELLDPLTKAGDTSKFVGQVMREVCITEANPYPTAIAFIMDVTGSNYDAAVDTHAKLPQMQGVLQRTGIPDPQILIGATGDATSDRVPLQIGQFESDNRIDAQIEALYLEGNGGSQRHETYELAAYYLWKHTYLEPYHQQGRKGYAFFVGDEMPYDAVRNDYNTGRLGVHHTLESLTGDRIQADIPTEEVFKGLQEQYEVFFLFQRQGAYREEQILPAWRPLLGENVVILEDPNTVCEFIAGLLAMREGDVDINDVAGVLGNAGFDKDAIASVSKTLAVAAKGGGGPLVTTQGTLDLDGGGADRL
jgi:hypothetical protein